MMNPSSRLTLLMMMVWAMIAQATASVESADLRLEGMRQWRATKEATAWEAMAHFEQQEGGRNAEVIDGETAIWLRFDIAGRGGGVLEWREEYLGDWAVWQWRNGAWGRVADARSSQLRHGLVLRLGESEAQARPFLVRAETEQRHPMLVLSSVEAFELRKLRSDMLQGCALGLLALLSLFGILFGVKFRIRQLSSHGNYVGLLGVFLFLQSEWASAVLPWEAALRLPFLRLVVLFFLAPFLAQFLLESLGKSLPEDRRRRWSNGLAGAHIVLTLGLVVAATAGWLSSHTAFLGLLGFVILAMGVLMAEAWRLRGGQMQQNRFFWAAIGLNGLGYVGLWLELGPGWRLFMPGLSVMVLTAVAEAMLLVFALSDLFSDGISEGQTLTSQVQQLQRDRLQAYVDGLEEEKRRVASELHDDVVGDLVLMHSNENMPLPTQVALKNIVRKVRGLSQSLSPFGVDQRPVAESLQDLVARYSGPHLQVRLHLDDSLPTLSDQANFQLFRIAQEAVHNAFKHAEASLIDVSLHADLPGQTVTLSIEDNGIGFSPAAVREAMGKGQGIRNFEHRSSLIGAELNIESAAGKGTYISVDVPFEEQA